MKLDQEPRLTGVSATLMEWARKVVQVVNDMVDSKAPLDSPKFTGTPTAPTPANTDNSPAIATTAWVRSAMSNIATAAGFAMSFGATSFVKFPSWLGGWVIQGGTTVVTCDFGGNAIVSYPLTYPTSERFTLAVSGDSAILSGALLLSMYRTNWPTVFGFAVHAANSTNAAASASATIRVNWISLGN